MKILIIGIGRSGTTSLLNGIAKQGYTKIYEPYGAPKITRKNLHYLMIIL